MKEHPILFKGEMVRAILAGRKTQTRRLVNPQPARLEKYPASEPWLGLDGVWYWKNGEVVYNQNAQKCPYGQPGDGLWVRESFFHEPAEDGLPSETIYRADMSAEVLAEEKRQGVPAHLRWVQSIHMPRKLSRINLMNESVRVERLQSISREDAAAEGMCYLAEIGFDMRMPKGPDKGLKVIQSHQWPEQNYARYIDAINGPGTWASNPWVWVIGFPAYQQAEAQ